MHSELTGFFDRISRNYKISLRLGFSGLFGWEVNALWKEGEFFAVVGDGGARGGAVVDEIVETIDEGLGA